MGFYLSWSVFGLLMGYELMINEWTTLCVCSLGLRRPQHSVEHTAFGWQKSGTSAWFRDNCLQVMARNLDNMTILQFWHVCWSNPLLVSCLATLMLLDCFACACWALCIYMPPGPGHRQYHIGWVCPRQLTDKKLIINCLGWVFLLQLYLQQHWKELGMTVCQKCIHLFWIPNPQQ